MYCIQHTLYQYQRKNTSWRKYGGNKVSQTPNLSFIFSLTCHSHGQVSTSVCWKAGMPVFQVSLPRKNLSCFLIQYTWANNACQIEICQRKLALVNYAYSDMKLFLSNTRPCYFSREIPVNVTFNSYCILISTPNIFT